MKISGFAARRFAPRRRFAAVAALLAFSAWAASAAGQASDADAVAVQLRAVTPNLVAYAQVEPISVLPVDAAETGVVEGLRVLPGMHVRTGEELAHLTGPGIRTLLIESEADVRSARAQLDAAQKTLATLREQLPSHLTTRQAVHQAESAEAQAQTALDNAQSRLSSVRQLMTLPAPASGIVLALNSANGQLVSAGQPVVTLQPDNQLWLRAAYYGTDLKVIRPGMTGSFMPADGSPPIAVRVASIPGMIAAGGSESIALVPASAKAAWISGEAGTVTLDLPPRKLVAVPTRALVLNQGKWWVMVHTSKGDRPEEVTPGPVEGWNTFIESGLAPGTQVIVNNAYLLFHASIAEQFQIPD
jgi:cobalt-zinc-cadmium efflux system membrane fusion protein